MGALRHFEISLGSAVPAKELALTHACLGDESVMTLLGKATQVSVFKVLDLAAAQDCELISIPSAGLITCVRHSVHSCGRGMVVAVVVMLLMFKFTLVVDGVAAVVTSVVSCFHHIYISREISSLLLMVLVLLFGCRRRR